MNADELMTALRQIEPEMIAIRRRIHQHPETCYEEFATAALVAERLEACGIATVRGVGGTGVVGTLHGARGGNRAVGLRADMDALNITEQTGLPYASQIPGKMHGCGHDGHTAMLLGAARHLAANPDFAGTVHFIFQPAEEGGAGALAMLDDGLFDRFPCDSVYALHNKPGIAVGAFATRPGPMLAATNNWTVRLRGSGGHGGSSPHLAGDPTIALAQFILGLQAIIGRNVPPAEPAVLSVAHIAAGAAEAPNVIPAEVVIRGTARSYAPAVRSLLKARLQHLAEGLAALSGCTAVVTFQDGYPALINSPAETAIAISAATALVGAGSVDGAIAPLTAGEDFAYLLQRRPGANMMIGNGPGGHLHTPGYDFNDRILVLGAAYWVSLVKHGALPQTP